MTATRLSGDDEVTQLFAIPEEIQVGCSVKVINADSEHYGRRGRVEAAVGPPGQSGSPEQLWQVVFEWPMGGLTGRATFGEDELEIVSRL